jgi:deoxyribonuclease-4
MSVAGGLWRALHRGREAGCRAIQIFTSNNVQWRGRPLAADAVSAFRDAVSATGIRVAAAHAGYLINLASPDRRLRDRSARALARELRRARALAIPWVVVHPGAAGDVRPARAIPRAAAAARRVLGATAGAGLLFETTAGQGTGLGSTFEELRELLDRTGYPPRTGVCADTCHMFAAGYDLRSPDAYARTMDNLDRAVGLRRLHLVHLNDARCPLGSRRDRHEHIGLGLLGNRAFRNLLRDPRLRHIPMILETPKGKKGRRDWDTVNLRRLSRLAQAPR